MVISRGLKVFDKEIKYCPYCGDETHLVEESRHEDLAVVKCFACIEEFVIPDGEVW